VNDAVTSGFSCVLGDLRSSFRKADERRGELVLAGADIAVIA